MTPPSWATSASRPSPPSPSSGRIARLRRGQDFQRVLRQGTRVVIGPLSVTASPGPAGLRVGFVCGRRVGGAVARNRARRLLREAWRAGAFGPSTPTGAFDVVVVARPEVLRTALAEITQALSEALRRLDVVAR